MCYVLTGAADNQIRLFRGQKPSAPSLVYKGHSQPVRALVRHPSPTNDTFASASNDGTIKLWNYKGENLTTLIGHDTFVYSLAVSPHGDGLFSSGEDRSVKIWSETHGDLEQNITLPATSVWSIAVLQNGDIGVGSSDGMVRIFTKESARVADDATLKVRS